MKGKWFLLYEDFDDMENHIANAILTATKELKSTNEPQAVLEGQKIWREVLSKGTHEGYDKITYPRSPRVIYEIKLEAKEK